MDMTTLLPQLSSILSMAADHAGIASYVIWEFWLGQNKWKSSSTLELTLRAVHDITGNLIERIDGAIKEKVPDNEPPVDVAPVALNTADVAAGQVRPY